MSPQPNVVCLGSLLRNTPIIAIVLSVGAALPPATARAQDIYVTNYFGGTIAEYTTSGGTVLVSGLLNPRA